MGIALSSVQEAMIMKKFQKAAFQCCSVIGFLTSFALGKLLLESFHSIRAIHNT